MSTHKEQVGHRISMNTLISELQKSNYDSLKPFAKGNYDSLKPSIKRAGNSKNLADQLMTIAKNMTLSSHEELHDLSHWTLTEIAKTSRDRADNIIKFISSHQEELFTSKIAAYILPILAQYASKEVAHEASSLFTTLLNSMAIIESLFDNRLVDLNTCEYYNNCETREQMQWALVKIVRTNNALCSRAIEIINRSEINSDYSKEIVKAHVLVQVVRFGSTEDAAKTIAEIVSLADCKGKSDKCKVILPPSIVEIFSKLKDNPYSPERPDCKIAIDTAIGQLEHAPGYAPLTGATANELEVNDCHIC